VSPIGRCGCDSGACQCVVQGGDNVTVTGTGSLETPYIVSASVAAPVADRMFLELAGDDPGNGSSVQRSLKWQVIDSVGTSLTLDASGSFVTSLADGIYVATAAVHFAVAASNRGRVDMAVSIDDGSFGHNQQAYLTDQMVADGQQISLTGSVTWHCPAGGQIYVTTVNAGTQPQTWGLCKLSIQRIS